MMWILAISTAAMANTWGPVDHGFLSATRLDAPTDGVLLYGSNYVPEVSVVTGPNGVEILASELVTGLGALPAAMIHPPVGGWVAHEMYMLEVLGYGGSGTDTTAISFTTGAGAAPIAQAPVVQTPEIGAWTTDEREYPWGCCTRLRTISVEVEVPDADPWSYVELVGDFELDEPNQITQEKIHTHLDLGVGPGPHTLTVLQWLENGTPQPPCFDIVAVAASGQPGPSERVCAEDAPSPANGGDFMAADPGCGCGTAPPPANGIGILLCVLFARRRQSL